MSYISFSTRGELDVTFLCGLSVEEINGGSMGGIIVCMSGGILGGVRIGIGDCAFLCIGRPGGLGGGPGCGGGMWVEFVLLMRGECFMVLICSGGGNTVAFTMGVPFFIWIGFGV